MKQEFGGWESKGEFVIKDVNTGEILYKYEEGLKLRFAIVQSHNILQHLAHTTDNQKVKDTFTMVKNILYNAGVSNVS